MLPFTSTGGNILLLLLHILCMVSVINQWSQIVDKVHPQEKTLMHQFQINGPLPLQWIKLLPFLTRLLLWNICRIHICGLLFSNFNHFNSHFIYYFDVEFRTKKSWVELLWEIKMHGPQLAWWTVVLLHSHSWAFIVFLLGAAMTRATASGLIQYYWSGLALSLISNGFEHFFIIPIILFRVFIKI